MVFRLDKNWIVSGLKYVSTSFSEIVSAQMFLYSPVIYFQLIETMWTGHSRAQYHFHISNIQFHRITFDSRLQDVKLEINILCTLDAACMCAHVQLYVDPNIRTWDAVHLSHNNNENRNKKQQFEYIIYSTTE